MKKWRIPIRVQGLIMYMVIVSIICLSYLPLSSNVRERLTDNYKAQTRQTFEQSMELFENSVKQLYSVSDIMNTSSYCRECLAYSEAKPTKEFMPKLYMASGLIRHYLMTVELADEVFVYFRNIGAVVDARQIYLSIDEFIKNGLIIKDISSQETMGMLEAPTSHHQYETVTVRGNTHPALILFIDSKISSMRVGVVYQESTLMDLFHLNTLPAGSSLEIVDNTGAVVYNYGDMRDGIEFSGITLFTGFEIKLMIPQSYYDDMLKSFDNMFIVTVVVALGVGILLSIAFSLISYKPVKMLLHESNTEKAAIGNEYAVLYEHIKSTNTQLNDLNMNTMQLKTELRDSLFARLLNGTVQSSADIELSFSVMPELKLESWLAIIKLNRRNSANPEDSFAFLRPLINEGFYLHRIDYSRLVVLFEANPENIDRFTGLVEGERQRRKYDDMAINVGVSERFTGIQGIRNAYHQAQLALLEENGINYFVNTSDAMAPQLLIDFGLLQKIYELVIAGQEEAVVDIITAKCDEIRKKSAMSEDISMLCCMLEFSYKSVISDLRLSDISGKLHSIHDLTHMNVDDMMNALSNDAHVLCENVRSRRPSREKQNAEAVMNYVRENYCRPDIYAESISEAVGVNVNTVYQIARESTGRSLGDYIEEMRINRACELLTTTKDNVIDISVLCGYVVPGTFYRVFKQRIGLTPSQYRKQHENHTD